MALSMRLDEKRYSTTSAPARQAGQSAADPAGPGRAVDLPLPGDPG